LVDDQLSVAFSPALMSDGVIARKSVGDS